MAVQRELARSFYSVVAKGPAAKHIRRGWGYAAAGYLVGIALYVLSTVFLQISILGASSFSGTLVVLFGPHLVVACPGVITCLNLATRGADRGEGADRPLFDWTIAGCALLAPLLAVAVLFGAIGILSSGAGGGAILSGLVVQLAGFVIAVVATAWALYRIGAEVPAPAAPTAGETVPPTATA